MRDCQESRGGLWIRYPLDKHPSTVCVHLCLGLLLDSSYRSERQTNAPNTDKSQSDSCSPCNPVPPVSTERPLRKFANLYGACVGLLGILGTGLFFSSGMNRISLDGRQLGGFGLLLASSFILLFMMLTGITGCFPWA